MPDQAWLRSEEHLKGVLIGPTRSNEGTYVVLFPYTRQGVRELRPGTLVAARNFSSTQDSPSYSILEISVSRPVHYALGETAERSEGAYPGFRVEAARAAAEDWEQTEPVEETTKIRAEVVSTGFKMTMTHDGGWLVEEDDTLPMPGGDVQLLTQHGMDRVLNEGMTESNSVEVAQMLVSESVPLRVKPSELVRKHFGVFGFTGTGKSNLVSTLVSRMISSSQASQDMRGLKVVIVDYMQEYFPLLADVFAELDSSMLLYLDISSLPGRGDHDIVAEAISGRGGDPQRAAELMLRNLLVPDELDTPEVRQELLSVLASMISQGKVKVLTETSLRELVRSKLRDLWDSWDKRQKLRWLGHGERPINKLMKELQSDDVTIEVLKRVAKGARKWAESGAMPKDPLKTITSTSEASSTNNSAEYPWKREDIELTPDQKTKKSQQKGSAIDDGKTVVISQTAGNCLLELAEVLEEIIDEWGRAGQLGSAAVSLRDIVQMLNRHGDSPMLVVAVSDRPSQLRRFFIELSREMYEIRKARGQTSPICLLIIDEADEYINTEKEEQYREARSAAETIARRGRKLGLGLGVATQRIAYLDTKVISQLHTYFVSKLPRANDRDRVAEAYGVPRSYIDRALSLRTGEWLVMSHSATRIRGKPILARFENAAARVRQRLVEAER